MKTFELLQSKICVAQSAGQIMLMFWDMWSVIL